MITFHYFKADWCGPCKTVGPLVDSLAILLGVTLVVHDTGQEAELALAQAWNVRSIPTVVIHEDGEETFRAVGGLIQHDVLVREVEVLRGQDS